MSDTFYHGRQRNITNTQTPFLYEEINELDNDLIVCFGVQGDNGKMTAFRYMELGFLFKERRNFTNPLADNEIYPQISIAKLKNLCKLVRSGDDQDIIDERQRVYEAIANTELFTDASQTKARELYEMFEQSDDEAREKITSTVEKLFHLSMYMRGWSGEGEYPISHAPVDNQALVDLNVTNAVIESEQACSDLGNIGQIIMDLPLLKYYGGEFFPNGVVENGRTITERLAIVKMGEDHDNYNSCIRISSNLFAMTAYRYMEILGMQRPFQPDRLRDIS